MKKIITLFAALCCMVGMARAAFSDGVTIYVQGTEMKAENQACFTSDKITKGHMSYDPVHHILYMVDVTITGSTARGLEIYGPAKADKDFKVTIMLCGSGGSSVSTTASTQYGLGINCPVELRGYGLSLTCEGTRGGIVLGTGASLTINGGIQVTANGDNYGICGAGTDTFTPLKIENGTLKAYSKNTGSGNACITKVDLSKVGCEISSPTGADYDASKSGSVVDDKGNYITGKAVDITPLGKNLLYVYPRRGFSVYDELTGIVGTFAIKKGEETQLNPCVHVDGDVFTANLVEGPESKEWEGISVMWNISVGYSLTEKSATSAEIKTTTAKNRGYARLVFVKKVAMNSKMYMVDNEGSAGASVLKTTNDFAKSEMDVNFFPLDVRKATNITYANNGKGNLYYTKEDGSKAGVYGIGWEDLKTNQKDATVQKVRDLNDDYYPYAGLSYNVSDGLLYGIAKKKADSKWYLVTISTVDGTLIQKGVLSSISASNPAITMAIDNKGDIYSIVYQKEDPLLYKIDPSTGKMSLYSHLGFNLDLVYESEITTANMYKFHSMQFDYETNKLYWWGYSTSKRYYIHEIDMTVGHADFVAEVGVADDNAVKVNVGMFQELPKSYAITAKTKEGNVGTTLVNGKNVVSALEGSTVTLTAEGNASEGTVFKQWNDGNKENPRTVKVTGEATYEAEYWYGEGIEMYPIWICGKQVHDNRLTFDKSNLSSAISAGTIKYDPKAKVLKLDGVTMASSSSDGGIVIGEESSSSELTIKVTADASIKGTMLVVPLKLVNAEVKMTGDKKLVLSANKEAVDLLKGSTLTIEAAGDMQISSSSTYAFVADDDDNNVVIRGSKLSLAGSTNIAYKVANVTWEYSKPTPSNAYYDTENKKFTKGEGGAALTSVSYAVDGFTVRCEPTEEGTGTFSIHLTDNTGETFENVGWFKSGAKVTIDAYGAEGHNFGYWTDATDKEYSREFTISADLTKQARFFHEVLSSDTWYGIHNGKVASFKLYEFGKEVINPQECFTVTGVKAGDYVEGEWYYVDGTALKLWPFDGGFDKETKYPKKESEAYVETVTTTGVPTGITDYAYNMMGGEHYGVSGKELYTLTTNSSGNKIMEKVGSLKNKYKEGETEKTKDVTGIGIAYDANSTLYVLGADGALYTMDEIDDEKDEVWLRVVGDEKKGGKINETVSAGQQSLAFDHVTGELFWSDSKYIRLIDMDEMKCHIVADLGFKQGSAGVVKAMHRMDQSVTVKALIADSCAGMGTVAVGDKAAGAESKAYFIAGVPVTVTAYPAEGYKFVKWMTRSGKKDSDMKKNGDKNPLQVSASGVTYVAYFEATGEGLESVQNSEFRIQKVIIGGQIYIIKGDKMYNMTGNRVK